MIFNIFSARIPLTTRLSVLATIVSIICAIVSGYAEITFMGLSLTVWIFLGLIPCWKLSIIPENNRPPLPISLALTIVTALQLILYWSGVSQSLHIYQFLIPLLTLIMFYSLWAVFYLLLITTDIFKYTLCNLFSVERPS